MRKVRRRAIAVTGSVCLLIAVGPGASAAPSPAPASLAVAKAATWVNYCTTLDVGAEVAAVVRRPDGSTADEGPWLHSLDGAFNWGYAARGENLNIRNALYSFVLHADAPIGGQIDHDFYSRAGQWARSSSEAPEPGTEVWVPAVERRAAWDSVLALQNTDLAAATVVTVSLVAAAGWGPPGRETVGSWTTVLPPGGSTLVDLARDAAWADLGAQPFVGSARVAAERPLAVEHILYDGNANGGVAAHAGQPIGRASSSLVAPAVFHAPWPATLLDGSITEITLLNPGTRPVTATAAFTGTYGSCAGLTMSEELALPAGALATVSGTTLPRGCAGHMEVDGSAPLLGVVTTSDARGGLAAFNTLSPADAFTRLAANHYFKGFRGLATALFVMNPWQEAVEANASLLMWAQGGSVVQLPCCDLSLEAGGGAVLFMSDLEDVPEASYGQINLEASAPVMAVTVDVPVNVVGEVTANRLCSSRTTDMYAPALAGYAHIAHVLRAWLPALESPPR